MEASCGRDCHCLKSVLCKFVHRRLPMLKCFTDGQTATMGARRPRARPLQIRTPGTVLLSNILHLRARLSSSVCTLAITVLGKRPAWDAAAGRYTVNQEESFVTVRTFNKAIGVKLAKWSRKVETCKSKPFFDQDSAFPNRDCFLDTGAEEADAAAPDAFTGSGTCE